MREFMRRKLSNKKLNEATDWTNGYDHEISKPKEIQQSIDQNNYETGLEALSNHNIILYFDYLLFFNFLTIIIVICIKMDNLF
jgi:hypothetical protein